MNQLTGKEAQRFVKSFEGIFAGLPHLPKGIINFLVAISPWGSIIGGVFTILAGLGSVLAFANFGRQWRFLGGYSVVSRGFYVLEGLVAIVTGILMIKAFGLLRSKKFDGWMLLFWINILGLVQMAVNIMFGYGGVLLSLLMAAIGFYALFEVKKSYK